MPAPQVQPMSAALVLTVSLGYLALLFVIAYAGDRRAARGHSLINSPWTYALSLGVYCTAWTYFGSVGRAASGGLWFLPIYLGPTMAMVLGWMVLYAVLTWVLPSRQFLHDVISGTRVIDNRKQVA